MKVIDTEVPDWVRYITQDKTGAWTGHETMPRAVGHMHYWISNGKCLAVGSSGVTTKNWEDQLYEV